MRLHGRSGPGYVRARSPLIVSEEGEAHLSSPANFVAVTPHVFDTVLFSTPTVLRISGCASLTPAVSWWISRLGVSCDGLADDRFAAVAVPCPGAEQVAGDLCVRLSLAHEGDSPVPIEGNSLCARWSHSNGALIRNVPLSPLFTGAWPWPIQLAW